MPTDFLNVYRPEVHGHRGCRGLRPENTISAFLHALALGVDVLEMDVVISQDNKVVVSHEPWLNSDICFNPDGQPIDSATPSYFNLYQMPYKTIRQCDCGQLRHPNFPTQQPEPAHKPLLSEVLRSVADATSRLNRSPVRFSIEIKCSPAGDLLHHPVPSEFLALVLADLITAQVIARTTLLCFDARILQLACQFHPELATCLLIENDQAWVPAVQALGFVPTAFGPDFRTVTPNAVQLLRAAFPTLRLVPWTVNTRTDMEHLMALRVEGITTDFPDLLLSLVRSHFPG